MKIPVIYERPVETVNDLIAALQRLDGAALIENEHPDEDDPALLQEALAKAAE